MKKKLLLVLCVVLIFVSTLVCEAETLNIGETMTLTASDASTSYPPMGTVSRIHSWYTDDSSVVELVSYNGYTCTIRAKSAGTAKITNKQSMTYASYNAALGVMNRSEQGFGGIWTITVNAIDPTGISIPGTLSVEAEDSQTLTPTYTPSNASSALTWESSDTTVATVSNGTVYGIKPGTATITVKTANGYSDTCKVTVTAPKTVFSSVTPANNKENVASNTVIRFTYNIDITKSSAFSSIKLYDNTAKSSVSITKETDGKTLIITPENSLLPGHSYTATVPSKAVENLYGAKNTAEVKTTFKIAPLCATSTVPAMNAMDVDVDTDISVTFDAEIEKGTKWSSITLKDESGKSVTFDKSLSGSTLIVNPKADLNYFTKYTLTVPVGAVACDGADSEDGVTLTFKTMRDADKVYPPEFVFENGKLTITAEENTSIYYTVDGGVPIISGELYSGPITFATQNIHVRAVAVRNGRISEERKYTGNNTNTTIATAFGGSNIDYFEGIAAAEDGYVAVGLSNPDCFGNGDWIGVSGKGGSDAIIVKYNTSGKIEWKKNFGGSGYDRFRSIVAVEDGYVAVGETNGFVNVDYDNYDAIIVKYDKDGNVVWKKSIDYGWQDDFCAIAATADSYVAVGDFTGKAAIVKYDTDGNVIWKNSLNGYFYGITTVEDGYVVVGSADSDYFGKGDWTGVSGNGGGDAVILKYDTDGNIKWIKSFGGSDSDCFKGIVAGEDGYVVAGYSYSGSFGNGDLTGVSGNGGNDAIIVKYDTDRNVVWKKSLGSSDSDYFEGITATEGGCVVAGYTYYGYNNGESDAMIVKYDESGNVEWKKDFGGSNADEFKAIVATEDRYVVAGNSGYLGFGTGDWTGISGKGNYDATTVSFLKFTYDSDKYISSESSKAAVSGDDTVIKGDEITVPVYFTPGTEATGVNIKLTYPAGFTYLDGSSEYEGVYIDEAAGTVMLSGDFSSDGAHISAGELCVLARLSFRVASSLADGDYAISINSDETFMMDSNYEMSKFGKTQNYEFSVVPVSPKAISLTGSMEVTTETQYTVTLFPENAVVEGLLWSVSDESIATVDQNGLLKPIRNGEATLTVRETGTGIEKSVDIVVSDIKTLINEIKSDTGNFAKAYKPSETERVLYVPKGTGSLKLTVDYSAGSVSSENGIFFKNVAKAIDISSFPFEFTVTKKESGYVDTVYTIKVIEIATAEMIPDVKINNDAANINVTVKTDTDADLIIAVYDENALKYVSVKNCGVGETNTIMDMKLMGDKLKIMLFENGSIKPLCDAYVVNY